jgi:hypothetical protein
MLNIVVMVTGIRYVYHTRCVHYGDYDNCSLVGKIAQYVLDTTIRKQTQITEIR